MEVTFVAVGEPDYFIFSPAGGAISGPHASALWAGPVPPISEASCFLVALFVSGFDHFIMWVVFSELLQSPIGHLNATGWVKENTEDSLCSSSGIRSHRLVRFSNKY